MFDVLHEIIDGLASLKAFDHNRQAELHAKVDEAAGTAAAAPQDEPADGAARA